jgi:hypothetical protein
MIDVFHPLFAVAASSHKRVLVQIRINVRQKITNPVIALAFRQCLSVPRTPLRKANFLRPLHHFSSSKNLICPSSGFSCRFARGNRLMSGTWSASSGSPYIPQAVQLFAQSLAAELLTPYAAHLYHVLFAM